MNQLIAPTSSSSLPILSIDIDRVAVNSIACCFHKNTSFSGLISSLVTLKDEIVKKFKLF